MKKLVVGLIAAALMALGFVGISSGPASADCGYQGCVHTHINKNDLPDHVKKGSKPTIAVPVASGPGAPTPKGSVSVTCTAPDGEHTVSGSANLQSGTAKITVNRKMRQKGTWSCTASYDPKNPFRRSSADFTVTVG